MNKNSYLFWLFILFVPLILSSASDSRVVSSQEAIKLAKETLNISNSKEAIIFSDKFVVLDGDSIISNNSILEIRDKNFKNNSKFYRPKKVEIRLFGVDAPEFRADKKYGDQVCLTYNLESYRCGKQSKEFLESLILNQAINCKIDTIDVFLRFVATCKIEKSKDTLSAKIIKAGFGIDFTRYSDLLYISQQNEASDNKLGLWSGCFIAPWSYRAKRRFNYPDDFLGSCDKLVTKFNIKNSATLNNLRAIDGDTLSFGGIQLQLDAIDSPEMNQTCNKNNKTKLNCGRNAHIYLENLLVDESFKCDYFGLDNYRRLLVECQNRLMNSLNSEMIVSGNAVAYREFSNKFIALEEQARENNKGIWDSCFIYPHSLRIKSIKNKWVGNCN